MEIMGKARTCEIMLQARTWQFLSMAELGHALGQYWPLGQVEHSDKLLSFSLVRNSVPQGGGSWTSAALFRAKVIHQTYPTTKQ